MMTIASLGPSPAQVCYALLQVTVVLVGGLLL